MEKNKKLIYISHPSSGKLENTLDIEVIIKKLYSSELLYNNYCFVSPVHCYGFMYNDVEYYKGLSFCTDLLKKCDEVWVFGDYTKSVGCKEEIKLSKELDINVRILGLSDDIDNTIKLLESELS